VRVPALPGPAAGGGRARQAAAEHAEIVGRLRAELSAAAERRATEHAHQLAELHRQLGAAATRSKPSARA
jgi:hypothetical protein